MPVQAIIAGALFLLLIIVVVICVLFAKRKGADEDDDMPEFIPEDNMFLTDTEAVSGRDYYRYHLDDDVSGGDNDGDEDYVGGDDEDDTDDDTVGDDDDTDDDTAINDAFDAAAEILEKYDAEYTLSVAEENMTEETIGFEDGATAASVLASMSENSVPEGFFDGDENHTENEYEIFRSGKFYIRGLADNDGKTDELDTAITEDTIYMATSLQGIKAGMLIGADGKIYLITDEKQAYLELSEGVLKMMGVSSEDLSSVDVKALSDFEPLSEAVEVNDTTLAGLECKEYVFNREDGVAKVYLRGNRLLRFANFGKYGILKSGYYISRITAEVPENRIVPDPTFKRHAGVLGMAKFFAMLMPQENKEE